MMGRMDMIVDVHKNGESIFKRRRPALGASNIASAELYVWAYIARLHSAEDPVAVAEQVASEFYGVAQTPATAAKLCNRIKELSELMTC